MYAPRQRALSGLQLPQPHDAKRPRSGSVTQRWGPRTPARPAFHQNGKPVPDMGFIRRVAILNADGARRVGELPQPSPADRRQ